MWGALFDLIDLLLRAAAIADGIRGPKEDDESYRRWLRATVTWLIKRGDGVPRAVGSDDERRWIDRAVNDRLLAWAPGRDGVVLGEAWAQALRRERSPYATWLRGVHAAASREPYVITSDQERAWAERAVDEHALAWDLEGVSLVPMKTGDDDGAPYR
jgi:hypothetical protein